MSNERAGAIKGGIYTYEGDFDSSHPRPPVPGKEQAPCSSDWDLPFDQGRLKTSSPSRKYFEKSAMAYEEAACTSVSSKQERPSSSEPLPPYLSWAKSLHHLLEDPDGAELFRQYLQSEGGQHANALDFWFACEGLQKLTDRDTLPQLAKVIYKRFFLKSAIPIDEELRREIGRKLKCCTFEPPVTLFDEAQTQIGNLISNTTYPNFLESDMYLQYVQSMQNPGGSSGDLSSESSSSSSSVSMKVTNIASRVGSLPTLHEDLEFAPSSLPHLSHTPGTGYHTPNLGSIRLTKDTLLATQKHRANDVCPKPEVFAGMYVYRGVHAAYSSYNPVSRQDSEMQSISSHSDVRTESDNMSLTDSSVDGRSMGHSSRRRAAIEARQARQSAALNKETHQTVIPRTQRLDTRQCQPMHPQEFAAILIEKLESVIRDRETQELLVKKLREGEEEKDKLNAIQLSNAIRERFPLDDDNDQDILDQHVSRVFSDLTPSKSPGIVSPRAHSPTRNRWVQGAYMRPRRKDKDGMSIFSTDSGNVYDFPEGSEQKLAMARSRTMPDYGDERFGRSSANRRSSSKKTLTDLTDSGVSVVSDTPPVLQDNSRVLAWVKESGRSGRNIPYTHSEMSMKHRGHRTNSTTSTNTSRHLERGSASGSVGPAQPFVADPSIPPPPIPNPSMQLEEARRRLEDDIRIKPKLKSSNKHFPELSQSSQSTLRKSMRGRGQQVEEVTTVVYSFCDEEFPYRTKIPGTHVTLKQFKDYLPKKGNYRYFFKTACEELGDQVIQEEICNDADVLPLCEGKIMAQVKAIE